MAIKFSQFTEKVDSANIDGLVGYFGNQNIRISASDLVGTVSLNASNITVGTLGDERLSSNVALKDVDNNFSVGQTINGNVTISNDLSANNVTIPNGEFYNSRRSSGNLSLPILGHPSGSDTVRLLSSGGFIFVNGALTEHMRIESSGNVGIGGSITSLSDTDELSIFAGTTVADNRARVELYGPSHATLADQAFIRGEQIVFTSDAASSERMRIDSSGNVGIGTSSPDTLLNLESASPILRLAPTTNNNTSALELGVLNGGTNGFAKIDVINAVNYDTNMRFFTNAAGSTTQVERMRIDSSGNVGIGTTSPSFQLQLSTDSAAKPTSALWTIASDARIKENIEPYTKGLDELMLINPITYDYNGLGGYEKGKGGVGIIAQEIKDVLPDSVSSVKAKLNEDDEEETDILNFNGHELTYVLINSIKELRAEIETLKQQINGQ